MLFILCIIHSVSCSHYYSGGSGEIKTYSDIEKFKKACGASSVMVARAAEWNVSIFRKEGALNKLDLIKEYIKIVSDRLYVKNGLNGLSFT